MSLQAFVWAVRMLLVIVVVAFGFTLYFLDPDTVGIYGSILFYSLGMLLLFGTLYLGILGIYRICLGDARAVHALGSAARQAILLVLGAVLILILLQNNLWYWWSILLIAAFILLLEVTLRKPLKKEVVENES